MVRFLIVLLLLLSVAAATPVLAQNSKAKSRKEALKMGRKSQPKNLGTGKTKLEKREVSKGMSVYLPKDFGAMPQNELQAKYKSAGVPLTAQTGARGLVDFIVTERRSDFPTDNLALLKDIYKASIAQKFTEVKFLDERIDHFNKRDFIVFEFVSVMKAFDEDFKTQKPILKYSYMMYALDKGRITVYALHAPASMREEWQPLASNIMHSVRMKPLEPSDKPIPVNQDGKPTVLQPEAGAPQPHVPPAAPSAAKPKAANK